MRELRLVSGLCHVMTAPTWGVSHILWDPHFPLQDVAVIIPTSWDCWKIKVDITCERRSRALACVEDSIDDVKDLALVCRIHTGGLLLQREVETPFPISARSGQG